MKPGGVIYRESFIPSSVSLWNNLDINIRNSPNILCFKSRIKENTHRFQRVMFLYFFLVSLKFLKRQSLSFWYNGHSIR
jgi:hypothetical protein